VASATCYALRLPVSAAPPQGGSTQALGGEKAVVFCFSTLRLFRLRLASLFGLLVVTLSASVAVLCALGLCLRDGAMGCVAVSAAHFRLRGMRTGRARCLLFRFSATASWFRCSRVPSRLTIRSSRRRISASLKSVPAGAILAPDCRGRRGLTQALGPMNKLIGVLALLILSAACSRQSALPILEPGPFVGIDMSKLSNEDKATISEASEDFRAVVQGKKPVHAEFDADAPLPSDGGTHYYKGKRYELTVLKSLSAFGEFSGIAYGPIITFDEDFAPGNASTISDIRVYSSEELRKFLPNRSGP
jgi:hypothetical protein